MPASSLGDVQGRAGARAPAQLGRSTARAGADGSVRSTATASTAIHAAPSAASPAIGTLLSGLAPRLPEILPARDPSQRRPFISPQSRPVESAPPLSNLIIFAVCIRSPQASSLALDPIPGVEPALEPSPALALPTQGLVRLSFSRTVRKARPGESCRLGSP